jgi:hypothetical protein
MEIALFNKQYYGIGMECFIILEEGSEVIGRFIDEEGGLNIIASYCQTQQ